MSTLECCSSCLFWVHVLCLRWVCFDLQEKSAESDTIEGSAGNNQEHDDDDGDDVKPPGGVDDEDNDDDEEEEDEDEFDSGDEEILTKSGELLDVSRV